MNREPWVGLLLCLVVVPAGYAQAPHPPWARKPGVLLYRLKDSATPEQRRAVEQLLQRGTVPAAVAPGVRSHRAQAWVSDGRSEEERAAELLATGAVAFAEPDYALPAAGLPNDPQISAQTFFDQIHAPAAWGISTGTQSIVVAVCDTGIDASHPDLATNLSLPGFNIVDGTTDTSPVADHGTAVAGVLAAVGNNAIGISGMAWSASLLPVRITNHSDTTAWCSDMARGIEWSADHGARVINLSYETSGCPATIDAAAQYAYGRGALVVIAAGNGSEDLSTVYPHGPELVLVGAVNPTGGLASFSNDGTTIDLVAPGVSLLTTQPSNGYGLWSGTSFASPLVAGTAALLLALNPAFTPDQLELFLEDTADGLGRQPGHDPVFGKGLLNAGAALSAAQGFLNGNWTPPTPEVPSTPTTPPGQEPPGATTTLQLNSLDSVRVFPNPWRADRHQGRDLTFDHLTASAVLKIFSLSGHLIKTLAASGTSAAWDLRDDAGQEAASGLYLYLLNDADGHKTSGKFALIR